MPEKREDKGDENSTFGVLWRASLVGIHLVAATFVGFVIGHFIDKYLGTRPWFTLIFLFIGIGAGFREVFKYAKFGGNSERNRK
ncbi:MAG: AtpZ/AtpI family protein [Nitrospirota bacterium]|jgi:ATP synthase protein I